MACQWKCIGIKYTQNAIHICHFSFSSIPDFLYKDDYNIERFFTLYIFPLFSHVFSLPIVCSFTDGKIYAVRTTSNEAVNNNNNNLVCFEYLGLNLQKPTFI